MDKDRFFSEKFRLVLKALSLSRAAVAAAIGVDKSLVGRWASGTVRPTEHNLSRISQLVTQRHASFTMADWDRDLVSFAEILGLDLDSPIAVDASGREGAVLPPSFIEHARETTKQRGSAYEGFWRTTRPSVIMADSFFHDHGMMRIAENGLLQVRMGSQGLVFEGSVFPAEGNIFSVLYDAIGATPLFLIFRGVTLPKAESLEGIMALAALDAGRTPAAVPIILERIGDLTGNVQADDAFCAELFNRDAIVSADELHGDIVNRLRRDIGPVASGAGGEMFLVASSAGPFTRGTTLAGQLRG